MPHWNSLSSSCTRNLRLVRGCVCVSFRSTSPAFDPFEKLTGSHELFCSYHQPSPAGYADCLTSPGERTWPFAIGPGLYSSTRTEAFGMPSTPSVSEVFWVIVVLSVNASLAVHFCCCPGGVFPKIGYLWSCGQKVRQRTQYSKQKCQVIVRQNIFEFSKLARG